MQLTREQVIADLRERLLSVVDDEHSICSVAAEQGIFCGGFAQWTFGELKRRFMMITRSRPRITPRELRNLANEWMLARQKALGAPLACDAEMLEENGIKRICRGWDEWSDEDLARFHADLCGVEVEIVPRGG